VKIEGDGMNTPWFSTKKIIAIMLTGVFCYLSIKGIVSSTEFLTVFTMIISFYFGQSTARDTLKDSNIFKKTLLTNSNEDIIHKDEEPNHEQ